jgi:hypothetical protein
MVLQRLAPVHLGEELETHVSGTARTAAGPPGQGLSVPLGRAPYQRDPHGKCAIPADAALRLARFVGTSERSWPRASRRDTTSRSSVTD